MKLAFLVLCHKNAEQINLLLSTLKDTNIDFFIHVDKKSDITPEIDISLGNAFLLPDVYRVDVRWGGVDAG